MWSKACSDIPGAVTMPDGQVGQGPELGLTVEAGGALE